MPWVQKTQSVLGASADPYVSNPLRRPRLDEGTAALKSKAEWEALTGYLRGLENAGDVKAVEKAVNDCLLSIARRLRISTVEYPVPMRISLDQLCKLLGEFISTPSGGLRPLIVATALMRILGEAFSIFPRVDSQGLNESDAAAGMPGDVMCYGPDGKLHLAVEVKDRELTLIDLDSTLTKARNSRLANILFTVPGLSSRDNQAIRERIESEWNKGINVHEITLEALVRGAFILLKEEWCVKFARSIGEELDARAAPYASRKAWSELLTGI